ncbi:zinc-dependent alcohol dehydrogenase family protein [Shewanella dokdonensis]|uniref:zinc-dependent alcohol dehydrogenase family protein n=1 Tax=Shewanella dokdonensis TaxID=712036 RepID=UPI00200FE64B|nr:zinc-dependent alcohol dehydrogenase family protein [Shewanella dokdonensis]MCL1075110.1 zinc-dependent alcohol dehydrogenase family protein [Shewanella dokdonensis]
MSNQMKAAVAVAANTPLSIRQLAIPEPSDNEVRIKVVASGVNPVDIKIATGMAAHARQPFPSVLGIDSAGIIDKLGANVEQFAIGDHVYGMVGGIGGYQGSLAEYQVVDADLLAKVPDEISLKEAASIPLVFITAWEGLVDRANVSKNMTVLIHGGAGGVGQMAIQIAKAHGATVFATGTAKHAAFIRNLGAIPIDYTKESVEHYVREYTNGEGFDIIYDTVGGEVLDNSFRAVKTYSGHVVSCLGWGTHSIAPLSFRGATYSGVFTMLPIQSGNARKHHGFIMSQATEMLRNGTLRVQQEATVYTLDDVNDVYQRVIAGKTTGKLAIEIAPE